MPHLPTLFLAGPLLSELVGLSHQVHCQVEDDFEGFVFVEAVFGWPGVGTMMVNAVEGRDYTTVQAGAFIVASVFVIVNWTAAILS